MVTLDDLQVRTLGQPTIDSPLAHYVQNRETNEHFVAETDRILYDDTLDLIAARGLPLDQAPSFETGGPRSKIFFNPATTRVGVVTCGGLCPGLNDVIRAVVLELNTHYGVHDVIGFQHGYAGMVPSGGHNVVPLTPQSVARINERGGTILGSSRGAQDATAIVDNLQSLGVDILIVIGGDGSMRGAHKICTEIERRALPISVVGVPKTIDNDIPHIGQSFGFSTAFSKAAESIKAARVEVEAAIGGVGIVKVMGRHAGFIACYAALANHDADFVLIPEVPFALDGPNGLLHNLRQRVHERGNAVIVVAEGAAQDLIERSNTTDASGNATLGDVAAFLRHAITTDFNAHNLPLTLRAFDPGYAIRSVPADSFDSVYCARLAQIAVHAAMSGRTDMVVGRRRHRFVHVPITCVTKRSHNVSPEGDLWLSVLESTAQPAHMS